ncbi:hypothetical protein ONZ45_g16596 [Pleurotus djamor]|nr:hypothetical protein ONZ45_g16596 [Pleurotus djamor]
MPATRSKASKGTKRKADVALATTNATEDVVAIEGRTTKKTKTPITAEPSPILTGPRKRTNERPGLIGKRKRRTPAEVAAEKAEKEAQKKAVAQAQAEATAKLAAMEVVDEVNEAQRQQDVVRRLSALGGVILDDDAEEFDWSPIGEVSSDDDVNPTSSPIKPKGKMDKRALLTDVAAQKQEIRAQKAKRVGLPPASGLKAPPKRQAQTSRVHEVMRNIITGGLTDEDASSVRPKFHAGDSTLQANKIVGIINDANDAEGAEGAGVGEKDRETVRYRAKVCLDV